MWSAAAVLVCALTMLGQSERKFHPIKLVETVPPGGSPNAEGFVTRDPDTIHIVTSSAVFAEAIRGPYTCHPRAAIAKIASVLVHEEWHLKNGPDERGAYLAQLTALRLLGFDEYTNVFWVVKRSMNHVVTAVARRAG